MAKWNIGVRGECVVVGRNSELADVSNPQGYIFDELYFVVAEDNDGYRRRLSGVSFEHLEEGERFALTLDEESPEADDWEPIDPRYGSSAYDANDDAAWERYTDEERDWN